MGFGKLFESFLPKDSSLVQKFVNYGQKMFYNSDPWCYLQPYQKGQSGA